MELYKSFFDQAHRLTQNDESVPLKERFAGANLQIPSDVNSILDVGCGRGDFLNSLPIGYEKTGIDIYPEALRQLNAHSVLGSIENLPFESSSFDLVTSFEVLEHLPDRVYLKALSELERVSKKYITISVPNKEILTQGLVACLKCCCRFNPSWHVRSFTTKTLQSLFKNHLLIECKECGPWMHDYSFPLITIYRFIYPRKMSSVAMCPQCGYSPAKDNVATKLSAKDLHRSAWGAFTKIAGNFARFLFIRNNRRHHWLLATYKRA